LHARMKASKRSILFFANTNFVVKCRAILPKMLNHETFIVNDGVGMDIASMLLYRRKFNANLNGTDFTPFFLNKSNAPMRVFLLGSQPEILNKAAYFLVHNLQQVVVGSVDGYSGIQNANLDTIINEAKPDVLLVAMGNPVQENWIMEHRDNLDVKFISGVGALFDFWAGNKPRAPLFIQKIRMEWLYRLSIEPKRLCKRYTVDILKFLIICIANRKKNSG